jgi:hypothetical protein
MWKNEQKKFVLQLSTNQFMLLEYVKDVTHDIQITAIKKDMEYTLSRLKRNSFSPFVKEFLIKKLKVAKNFLRG